MAHKSFIRFKSRLTQCIFFGNIFYGLCAVALSAEAMLQQRLPLNGFWYFFVVFIATILYYTYPYLRRCSYVNSNLRTNWYRQNYSLVWLTQYSITIILLAASVIFLSSYGPFLLQMPSSQWLLALSFPLAAAFYYGTSFFSLRRIGWLKPFMIGFIWAGLVSVYPVLYYDLVHNSAYTFTWVGTLLFFKNMMFIAVLCIMFDIKDYSADYLSRLKTFVVNLGLRKTIYSILIPVSGAGLGSFLLYAAAHDFSAMKVLLNTIPFVCLFVVALALRRRKSILYYLVVVDGLMMIKAICGILAIGWFS